MENLNLVLKFNLAGDNDFRIKAAKRFKIDGKGGLMIYDAETGAMETIDLRELRSFRIQPVIGSRLTGLPLAW